MTAHMGYEVRTLADVVAAGREHPTFAMADSEYSGVTGALARLALTVAGGDRLTNEAALQSGLNYYAAQGMTLVTVDHTEAGGLYVFSNKP